jgi:hypothetical protein
MQMTNKITVLDEIKKIKEEKQSMTSVETICKFIFYILGLSLIIGYCIYFGITAGYGV